MKKAILFGASGFIGSYLLDLLLDHPAYDLVTTVTRKKINQNHPKLKSLIGDFKTVTSLKYNIACDEVFIALGTTRKNTPNQDEYYQVDHDYPVLAAKIAKEKGAAALFIVSAVGADANSHLFYIKAKGEVERDLVALDFKSTNIFQPSLLYGHRKEERPMERLYQYTWPFLSLGFFGPLNKYKGIEGREVALAMIGAAQCPLEKVKIYGWKEMKGLLV